MIICDYGKKDEKGWSYWQVRHQVWWSYQKDRQEVLTATEGQVSLPHLWKGIAFVIQTNVRRAAAGIWKCRSCKTTFAGGAYEFSTSVAITAKVTMNRLKKLKEDLANPARQEEEQKDKKKKEKKKANKA